MFERFKQIGRDLFLTGLNDSHSGNISIRDGEKIVITSKFCLLSNLNERDMIEVSFDEDKDKDSFASRDLLLHRSIYKNTGAKAILHAHAPNLVALSITENKIMPQDTKSQYFMPQGLPIAKVRQPSSIEENTRLVLSVLNSTYKGVVVKGHGIYVYGISPEECFEMVSCLESSAKIIIITKQLTPPKQQEAPKYDYNRKRSAIPPSIGVMGRRTGTFNNNRRGS